MRAEAYLIVSKLSGKIDSLWLSGYRQPFSRFRLAGKIFNYFKVLTRGELPG